MKKQIQRKIPYRVYKKVFSNCKAWDYSDGKICVEFPEEYLNDKIVIPDNWYKGGNYAESKMDENKIHCYIGWCSDGGVRHYYAEVRRCTQYHPRTRSKTNFYSFKMALEWALETANALNL